MPRDTMLCKLTSEQLKLIAEPYACQFGIPDFSGYLRVETDREKAHELMKLPMSAGLVKLDASGDFKTTNKGQYAGLLAALAISKAIKLARGYKADGPNRRQKKSRKTYSDLMYLLEFCASMDMRMILGDQAVTPFNLTIQDGVITGYEMEDITDGTPLGRSQLTFPADQRSKEALDMSLERLIGKMQGTKFVHGDIKMSNILRLPDNRVKMIDPRVLKLEYEQSHACLVNEPDEEGGFPISRDGALAIYDTQFWMDGEAMMMNLIRKAMREGTPESLVFLTRVDAVESVLDYPQA